MKPVAWALYWNTGDLCRFTKYEPDAQEFLVRAKEDRHKNPSVVPLYAIPAGYVLVKEEEAKDAKRYAYLREDCPWTLMTEVFGVPAEHESNHEANKIALDECIDAALLTAAKGE